MSSIVSVQVTQTIAPTPNTLQKRGAFISQGATNLAAGTNTILTQSTDLAALLAPVLSLASLTQTTGLATATLKSTTIVSGTYDNATGEVVLTLAASAGITVGRPATIAGVTGTGSFAAIQGTFVAEAGSLGTTLKYAVAPGLTMTITGGNVNASLNLANGTTFWTTIAGASQSGYNGLVLATVTTDKTFTYAVGSTTVSPATGTPTATPPGVGELQQMNTTFFAQGSQQAAYVLELGAGSAAEGVTALAAWIAANPGFFYSYLVPRAWGAESTWATFLGTLSANTAKTYGFTTVTQSQYAAFALLKAAVTMVEAPGIASSEFSLASEFWVTLNYKPSSTNKVTPLQYSYLQGVTAWPASGYDSTLAALKAAGVNYVGTGAEGGISNKVLFGGTTMDLRPFNYWYSVDWVQINGSQALANAVINGSNDPINPLYYNQPGINRLQQVLAGVMSSGITFGLVLGDVRLTSLDANEFQTAIDDGTYDGFTAVNAIPFIPYLAANPNDYKAGTYAGLAVEYTPARGFDSITFNINVTDFVTQ